MLGWPVLVKKQMRREWCVHVRDMRSIVNSCLFFLLICVFFPLTMPPDNALLRHLLPGLVWIAMLLSLFLSAERLFHPDDEEGVLEQWIVSGYPMSLLVLAKLWVHWCIQVLPMILICPFLMILFQLSWYELSVVIASLVCGTPALLAWCAVAAAFATGLKQKNVLMGLVVFPLTVPIMILGSASIDLALDGLVVYGYLALLLAISCLAFGFLPFAIAGILRHKIN